MWNSCGILVIHVEFMWNSSTLESSDNHFAVAKPARQFGHAMQIKSSLFISLQIDSLYRLSTQKNLHLHDQMSGWLRHCHYVILVTGHLTFEAIL